VATPSEVEAGRVASVQSLIVSQTARMSLTNDLSGPDSTLARFLKDFGPALLDKYKPKGILVFSAHWETNREIQVTDYGDENPLLMDYYGFDQELYEVKFKSTGSSALSNRIVEAFKKAGIPARTTPKLEPRGHDGRGFSGPGLDHGVFIPFKFMFGDEFTNLPIVQASMDGSLEPDDNYRVGKAVDALRSENILILSGGLTIHNLRDTTCWSESTAKEPLKDFHRSIFDAVDIQDLPQRKEAMYQLVKHPGFRGAHPRADHFVPIYVAAGAGETGSVRVINAMYAGPAIAFGV